MCQYSFQQLSDMLRDSYLVRGELSQLPGKYM